MACNEITGTWISDPHDCEGIAAFGEVALHFMEDGQLSYTVKEGDKHKVIFMTYRIQGGQIITDQPSHPQTTVSEFELAGDKLVIVFGGKKAIYKRQDGDRDSMAGNHQRRGGQSFDPK